MLTELELRDFKSFEDQRVTLTWLDTVGKGRKKAMRELGARWSGVVQVCPEIADLRDRIHTLLEAPK